MEQLQNLKELPTQLWNELARASRLKNHAWRTPVLANIDSRTPLIRTLVLRASIPTQHRLRFYTDRRSRKWPSIVAREAFSALFYDSRKQWQLSVTGITHDVTPAMGDHIWPTLSVASRAAYASKLPPGEKLEEGDNGLPPNFFELPLADTEYARENFAVFELAVQDMEVFQLHRQGHRRAVFRWQSDTLSWKGEWLVP